MFLDVDNFKQVNDTLGHDVGDQVLVALGARLSEVLRPDDTVARLGGDEIAVLCEHVVDTDHAIAIADRLLAALQDPLALADRQLAAAVSIGIAVATHQGADPERLLREADTAMYRAKDQGRGRAVLSDSVSVLDGPRVVMGTEDRCPLEPL